jgi:hypothetical protein
MARTGESYAAARAQLDARHPVLHVSSGDSVALSLRQGGVAAVVVPWRDVLHEGPVPALPAAALARVRARYLAEAIGGQAGEIEREVRARDRLLAGAAPDEVVLWFEADLYDQLQLIQVLDRLGPSRVPVVTLVSVGEYPGRAHFGGLGELPVHQLLALRETAAMDVDSAAFELARRAWRAFTASDPGGLPPLAREQSPVLRHLPEAVERLLQEYPWVDDGLSLTERRVLRAVQEGAATKREVFEQVWRAERRPFLADTWCDRVVERLVQAGLIAAAPALVRTGRDRLTEVDRWIGGVHLQGAPRWRWDPKAETLVAEA